MKFFSYGKAAVMFVRFALYIYLVTGLRTSGLKISVLLFAFISYFSPGATQPIVGVYFTALRRALASSRTRLLDHTQRRATAGRTPLNE